MEHTLIRLLGALAAMSLVVSGCSVYDGSLLPDENALLPDGRPPRPTEPDNPAINNELVFRISDVLLNSEVDWGSVGRNLDGLVTTNENPVQQCSAPALTAAPVVDGPGGVDNAMGQELLEVIELVVSCLESELGNSHSAGEGTLMLWVQGWNGTANDHTVSVSLVVAADGTSADPEDVEWDSVNHRLVMASDGVTEAPAPTGLPTDYYYPRPDSFTGGGTPIPRLRDTSAYVSNGTIVYGVPDRGAIPLNAGIGSLTILVTDGLMLVTMNETFDAITEGELSGRFSLADLLDAGESIGVCSGIRDNIESQFEEILDVMSNPNTPPNTDLLCDAMSLGIPFQGRLASFPIVDGSPVRSGTNPPLPNACANGGNPCEGL